MKGQCEFAPIYVNSTTKMAVYQAVVKIIISLKMIGQ